MLRRLMGRDRSTAPVNEVQDGVQALSSTLEVGWITDTGRVRDHNEDAALVIVAGHEGKGAPPPFGLLIVADGMGGHRAGEDASSVAVRVAGHQIAQQSYLPSLLSDERDARQPALTEILTQAVQAANEAVARDVPGGGTTLICALILGTQAYVAHVGDSRAYVLSADGLEQMTRDHSIVDRLVQAGDLTPEEALEHPQRNVLYRAVGQSGTLEVDTHVRKVPAGAYLLICSDGLWNSLTGEEIVSLVRDASSPQRACETLVHAANDAGGRDNITVVLWRSPLG